MLSSGTSKQL